MTQASAKKTQLRTSAADLEELATAALDCQDNDPDVVPEGWYTVVEVMRIMGKSKVRTRTKLNNLLERGLAERKKFRVISINETTCSINHYRLVKRD